MCISLSSPLNLSIIRVGYDKEELIINEPIQAFTTISNISFISWTFEINQEMMTH